MMSKKWSILISGLSLVLGMVLAVGTNTNRATSIAAQPLPVRAPAPSPAPAKVTPVFTVTAVSQPTLAPQPAPGLNHATSNLQPTVPAPLCPVLFLLWLAGSY